uniref:Uncharacterized protein n=1 Tax=Arundo donax TaxID=35708 RepID=A0A0A9H1N5_ARUDO
MGVLGSSARARLASLSEKSERSTRLVGGRACLGACGSKNFTCYRERADSARSAWQGLACSRQRGEVSSAGNQTRPMLLFIRLFGVCWLNFSD